MVKVGIMQFAIGHLYHLHHVDTSQPSEVNAIPWCYICLTAFSFQTFVFPLVKKEILYKNNFWGLKNGGLEALFVDGHFLRM